MSYSLFHKWFATIAFVKKLGETKIMLLKWDLGWQSDVKCAAGKAHVDTKSTEEETDQEMDYCLGTYHLLPSVPVQSFGTKMDKL